MKFPAKLVCLENINLENISNLIFSRKWNLFVELRTARHPQVWELLYVSVRRVYILRSFEFVLFFFSGPLI